VTVEGVNVKEEQLATPRSSVRAELAPQRLIPTLTAGIIIGVLEVVLATSFSALVFFGDAAIHLPSVIGLNLFAGIVVLVVLAVRSSLPGVVGSVQDTTAAILALISASIIAGMPGAYHETFLTILAVTMVATFLTGVFFLTLGRLKLGNLVRFIPYPVIGGFLAGTGWLLFKGGVGILADRALTLQALHRFVRPDPMLKWVPGVAFAIILYVLVRRFRHYLIIPGAVVIGIVIFYAVLLLTDQSLLIAKIHGWVLGPFPYGENLWDPSTLRVFTQADWTEVLRELPKVLTVPVVAVLALLLNASGIELARNEDADLNRELRGAGLSNVAASVFAGIPGFHALSLTALAQRTGSTSRLVGLVAAGVCGAVLAFGAEMLSLVPRAVLGGLVVFLGLAFLFEWVVDSRSRLIRRDYVVVLLILLAVATLGFLQGIALGLVLAIVLFVVDYSRTDVVKNELTGDRYRSNVDRDPRHLEVLRREGNQIHILRLQGIVFFGTANALLERIRHRMDDRTADPVRFLVIDFQRVRGLDSSAVLAFQKIHQLTEIREAALVFCGLTTPLRSQLERGGFDVDAVQVSPDLDHAAQWCEDRVLDQAGVSAAPAEPLERLLRDGLGLDIDPARLASYLEPLDVPAGEEIIRQGEISDDMFFLESGSLTAVLTLPSGQSMRLRTMAPGVVVGEIGMYLESHRTASVVSETSSRLHRLSRQALDEMKVRDPELAAEVHTALARLLAQRLTDLMQSMDVLLE
jgi:SulP family sulfate permease